MAVSEHSIVTEGVTAGPRVLRLRALIAVLLALPLAYFVISYAYLASWHEKAFLWNTLIHENGRLTLAGSLFYFDHFLACVPMIAVFALCTAGGFALTGQMPSTIHSSRAKFTSLILLVGAGVLVLITFAASIRTVGWQRTVDYSLQRIERDGVLSKGGSWNQLQLSNVPIALGTIALSSTLVTFGARSKSKRNAKLILGGKICIGMAAGLALAIMALSFNGWQAFLNPRWMAHSLREIATYPLTGIPIALAAILLVEWHLSGLDRFQLSPDSFALILVAAGVLIAVGEFIWLRNVDILAMAQKPSFSAAGLSIPYLLTSHVFEHFLDFVLIGPLTGGIYSLVRFMTRSYDSPKATA